MSQDNFLNFRWMLFFDIIVVTYVQYLKNILTHIVDSYHILETIEDKPGDLAKTEKQMLKLTDSLKLYLTKLILTKSLYLISR